MGLVPPTASRFMFQNGSLLVNRATKRTTMTTTKGGMEILHRCFPLMMGTISGGYQRPWPQKKCVKCCLVSPQSRCCDTSCSG